ncbi:MAG: Uncharacterised protein [Polaribacter sp. SA4-10]|nr:MAG: Uncharacterised protein [Polaribacter sp. SA4-10]
MSEFKKPNVGFWVISIIAFVWNLMGVLNYIAQAYMTEDMKVLLPQGQREYIENVPAWATAAFAIAVFAGLIGCLSLLFRKKTAKIALLISLLGVIVQMSHGFISGIENAYGPGGIAMPIMIIGLSIFLVWYSRFVDTKGWLS